jgi:hypothetical protein
VKIQRTLNLEEVQDHHHLGRATKFRKAMVEEMAVAQREIGVPILEEILTKIEEVGVIDPMEAEVEEEASDKMTVDTEENNKIEALIKEIEAPISEGGMKIIRESLRETLLLIDLKMQAQGRDHAPLTDSTMKESSMLPLKPNKSLMRMTKMMEISI